MRTWRRGSLVVWIFVVMCTTGCTVTSEKRTDTPAQQNIAPAKKEPTWEQSARQKVFVLHKRPGKRPVTKYSVPHEQLSQTSPTQLITTLKNWLFSLPCIEQNTSLVSDETAIGARYTSSCGTTKSISPFQKELTHIHKATGPGSLHLLLPTADGDEVVKQGWGEIHPWNKRLMGSQKIRMLMIFAPRDEKDLVTVQAIIYRSYLWSINKL